MIIQCTLPLSVIIWSSQENFSIPKLDIKINSHLRAKASLNGKYESVEAPEFSLNGGYFEAVGIEYVISTDKRCYQEDMNFEKLTQELGTDILRTHNRVIEVLRCRAEIWQLTHMSTPKDFRTHLMRWEVKYKQNDKVPFTSYALLKSGSLSEALDMFLDTFPTTPYFYLSKFDDVAEYLEENKQISITEQLQVQAIEAKESNDYRLAIFNYVVALEQAVKEYLNKALKRQLELKGANISDFLSTKNSSLEHKVTIILPLITHESWLKDIDFSEIKRAINIRNDIAHGKIVSNSANQLNEVDKDNLLLNVQVLIKTLINLNILEDASPEIKEIAEKIKEEFDIFVNIWIHKYHAVTVKVPLYLSSKRGEESLTRIIDAIADIRLKQDERFEKDKHLTVNFEKFPNERYARWRAGKITFFKQDSPM